MLHGFDRGLTLRLGPRPACRLVDMDDDGGLEQRESLEKEGIRLRSRSRGPPPPMEVENPSQSSWDPDAECTLSGPQVEKQELPESTQDAVVELSDRVLRSRKRGPPPPMELEHPGHSSSDDEWKLDGGTLTTVELEGCAVLHPPKIGKTSWDSCLCCSMSGGSLKNFMDRAWRTLHDAAEIRRDSVFFFLKEQGTIEENGELCAPRGVYHKACYTAYTSKQNLASIKLRKAPTPSRPSSPTSGSNSMQATKGRCEGVTLRSRLNNTDYQKCIFCRKDKKRSRNRWLNESLVRCDDDGNDPVITPKWMTQPAAPKALLELVSCGCSSGCETLRRRCRKSNLCCSAACRCSNCANTEVAGQDEAEATSEEST